MHTHLLVALATTAVVGAGWFALTDADPQDAQVAPGTATTSSPTPTHGTWSSVYRDDFDGELQPRWEAYTGRPKSDPRTRWDPTMVLTEEGRLVLTAAPAAQEDGTWNAGAVSNWRDALTYGRWQIRFRAARSEVLSYHFLLWPESEIWPPEIDIAEGFTARRGQIDAFVHWRDGDEQRKEQRTVAGDFTQWNTVGVEWTPQHVVFTLNGAPWAAVAGDAVPHERMWLALQAETQVCDADAKCPYDTGKPPPRIEIDWVQVDALVQ